MPNQHFFYKQSFVLPTIFVGTFTLGGIVFSIIIHFL